VKFFIAGDGPQRENIESMIEELSLTESVKLLGHVENVPELLSALDIFVLSSDSKEGVPQSVMQALLMNKQVVTTNSGSTKDLFYKNNFQLVNTSSVTELVNGATFFIENSGNNYDREYIVKNFSKRSMQTKVIEIYESLLT
jgi:glycosyltransferase involved in cell wall biosynthesis